MKFVSLRTKRAHRRGKLDKPRGAIPESFTKLRQQIHEDLRIQHPEWVQPNGQCPLCDSYEARLVELLETSTRTGSNESIVGPHRTLEQGLNQLGTAAV